MRAGWAAGRELESERGEGTGTSTPGDVEAPRPAVCVRRRLEPLARAPGWSLSSLVGRSCRRCSIRGRCRCTWKSRLRGLGRRRIIIEPRWAATLTAPGARRGGSPRRARCGLTTAVIAAAAANAGPSSVAAGCRHAVAIAATFANAAAHSVVPYLNAISPGCSSNAARSSTGQTAGFSGSRGAPCAAPNSGGGTAACGAASARPAGAVQERVPQLRRDRNVGIAL